MGGLLQLQSSTLNSIILTMYTTGHYIERSTCFIIVIGLDIYYLYSPAAMYVVHFMHSIKILCRLRGLQSSSIDFRDRSTLEDILLDTTMSKVNSSLAIVQPRPRSFGLY